MNKYFLLELPRVVERAEGFHWQVWVWTGVPGLRNSAALGKADWICIWASALPIVLPGMFFPGIASSFPPSLHVLTWMLPSHWGLPWPPYFVWQRTHHTHTTLTLPSTSRLYFLPELWSLFCTHAPHLPIEFTLSLPLGCKLKARVWDCFSYSLPKVSKKGRKHKGNTQNLLNKGSSWRPLQGSGVFIRDHVHNEMPPDVKGTQETDIIYLQRSDYVKLYIKYFF